ncbi:3'-5' exoribonuclease [Streptomyces sp. NPDC094048]|uniref:3'-5' exoribonuclease domain-containing protein n=1 Tax=unclassified Streptomyces TaxID=2593676 RepID=UPI00332306C5
MRIFYDTEFLDDGRTIDLISIGLIAEDGRELYAVSSQFNVGAVQRHGWLMANVWPSLPIVKNPRGRRGTDRLDLTDPDVRPRHQIARLVQQFIQATPDPQLWAYYSAYDHVALAQLFGPMSDLPAGIPMQTCDLVQEAQRLGLTPADLPQQADGHHNALADARHNLVMAQYMGSITR